MYFTSNFEAFKNKYLQKHGSLKLSKIEQKVYSSSSIKSLFEKSRIARIVPTEADFSSSIHTILYFITAGAETTAMGALFAIKYWDESVNSKVRICSEAELYQKYLAVMKRYGIR